MADDADELYADLPDDVLLQEIVDTGFMISAAGKVHAGFSELAALTTALQQSWYLNEATCVQRAIDRLEQLRTSLTTVWERRKAARASNTSLTENRRTTDV